MRSRNEMMPPADAGQHVAWCRYVTKHERPTRIVLCDSDAEGAFPVFRRPHDDECTNDPYARSVCGGMWADKFDDGL